MISRRWRRRLRVSEAAVALAVVSALVALGLAFFLRAYYGYDPKDYRPFDGQREKTILEGADVHR